MSALPENDQESGSKSMPITFYRGLLVLPCFTVFYPGEIAASRRELSGPEFRPSRRLRLPKVADFEKDCDSHA